MFLNSNINRMQSGISLYLAIIIMVILLAIVLGLTALLVGQMQMVREMGYSVIALSAADAGIEVVLMDRGSPVDGGCTELVPCSLGLGGAEYYLDIRDDSNPKCGASMFCIKSVGSYKGVRRAIEVTY